MCSCLEFLFEQSTLFPPAGPVIAWNIEIFSLSWHTLGRRICKPLWTPACPTATWIWMLSGSTKNGANHIRAFFRISEVSQLTLSELSQSWWGIARKLTKQLYLIAKEHTIILIFGGVKYPGVAWKVKGGGIRDAERRVELEYNLVLDVVRYETILG
ncbi:uncharacterized protein LOC112345326 [Selaginella moellendorffii]|uniref:uncharacterized protein LOC112345326 n=1 Tax=Selaginella moellendorffii TaxID=88036 RepID=UPI000D1CEFC5|nr:uncharacterized protein LOC112345326 [Selaginella moellendorffii]|eukprot:XP_024527546.1 uncharacterized protein LOC112345326 [Selaginella moellendorffii]